jgi:transcriptional antiterminator RfaH
MDYLHDASWYAIHTHPCREAVAAMNIERMGLEVFLPKIKQQKSVWGVAKSVIKPLFPGYLFARFTPSTYLHLIHYARGVRQVVGNRERPLPVDDEIIMAVRSGIGDEGYVEIEPNIMRRGDRVVVQEGPLQGLIGTLDTEVDDRTRVIILLEAIEYQARLLIDKRCLKPQTVAAR